jgi:SAM-dependent methyltransferase
MSAEGPPPQDAVVRWYGRAGLAEAILAAVRAAGLDPDRLRPEDLAEMDELHMRGRRATVELAAHLELGPTTRVLDVGSGIGGPSRYLSATHGCRVTGLDLTAEYVDVAAMLAQRTGLDDRLEYMVGDALAMPFPDASFDVAWTQHAAMNIPDKPRLYDQIARVLRPGGHLGLYDLVAGPAGLPRHYPLPWATDPSTSFLVGAGELRDMLTAAGFAVRSWRDLGEEGMAWLRERLARAAAGDVPALGPQVLFGPRFGPSVANIGRGIEEGRLALVEVVGVREG